MLQMISKLFVTDTFPTSSIFGASDITFDSKSNLCFVIVRNEANFLESSSVTLHSVMLGFNMIAVGNSYRDEVTLGRKSEWGGVIQCSMVPVILDVGWKYLHG